jgi:hypothetical protein
VHGVSNRPCCDVQARSSSPSSSAADAAEADGGAEEVLARSDLRKQLKEFTINTQVGGQWVLSGL